MLLTNWAKWMGLENFMFLAHFILHTTHTFHITWYIYISTRTVDDKRRGYIANSTCCIYLPYCILHGHVLLHITYCYMRCILLTPFIFHITLTFGVWLIWYQILYLSYRYDMQYIVHIYCGYYTDIPTRTKDDKNSTHCVINTYAICDMKGIGFDDISNAIKCILHMRLLHNVQRRFYRDNGR